MNDYLKELGKVCHIDEQVQIVKYVGSKRIQLVKPKYELITTHTARQTFVTQSLERGIRPEIIMKITGHKDIKTMMKYVKITDNVVRAEMMRGWN
jgi:integrase